ncbi:hypothetical protein YC2023_074652 [Brassica napus]
MPLRFLLDHITTHRSKITLFHGSDNTNIFSGDVPYHQPTSHSTSTQINSHAFCTFLSCISSLRHSLSHHPWMELIDWSSLDLILSPTPHTRISATLE